MEASHPETRRNQAEQRREEIISAAARLFCEKGYEGTSVRDIAREVGITEGLIYHYFPSKADLIVACWNHYQWHSPILRAIESAEDRPLADVLREIIRSHLQCLYENGTAVRMHAAEMLRDGELAELSLRYNTEVRDKVTEYLRRHQERGHIRPGLDPMVVAGVILGTSMSFFVVHGRLAPDEWGEFADHVAGQLTELIVNGLGVGTGAKMQGETQI